MKMMLLFTHAFAFQHVVRLVCASLALLGGSVLAQTPPEAASTAAPVPQLTLRIVGGLAGLHQYTRNEEPFWSKSLARLSAGKYAAEIVPFDRAGVPGSEMLRLLELGVVPFGTALMSSLQTSQPLYAAADLAGLSPNMASLRKVVAALRTPLENRLRIQHNVQLLALYAYPAQVVYCNRAFGTLADLKGRRVRVSSASQAEFLAALGATTVKTGFGEIMANIQSGNVDCAVTGTMSGNTLGLHHVTSHIHTMALSWGVAVFAANRTAWYNLPPDLKALLSQELPKLESAIWAESERETAEGLACNSGSSECRNGTKGTMVVVQSGAADEQLRKHIFANTVLPRWLARCGTPCADLWQNVLGPATDFGSEVTP